MAIKLIIRAVIFIFAATCLFMASPYVFQGKEGKLGNWLSAICIGAGVIMWVIIGIAALLTLIYIVVEVLGDAWTWVWTNDKK